jgi:hypothetical protein
VDSDVKLVQEIFVNMERHRRAHMPCMGAFSHVRIEAASRDIPATSRTNDKSSWTAPSSPAHAVCHDGMLCGCVFSTISYRYSWV